MSQTVLKIAFFLAALAITAAAQQSNLLPNTGASVPATKAQFQTERHLLASPTGDLYYDSAFAHGYRHGYEEGFHVGDLDLQMGREARKISQIAEYQRDCTGFKSSFGAKELFRRGYREGFHSGYQDAISGGEFRETEKAEVAAQGIKLLLGSGQRASFDQGFAGGYESAAAQQSAPNPITPEYADYLEQYCEKSLAPGKTYGSEYCSGYSRGYLLRETDNGASSGTEMARQLPEK
jgi:flagellar biosynthesis/type III secretory pathway protein FliH